MPRPPVPHAASLPPLVSVKGACEIIGIQKMTFKRWRDSGRFTIRPLMVGRDPFWTVAEIEAFAEHHGRWRAAVGAPVT